KDAALRNLNIKLAALSGDDQGRQIPQHVSQLWRQITPCSTLHRIGEDGLACIIRDKQGFSICRECAGGCHRGRRNERTPCASFFSSERLRTQQDKEDCGSYI